MYTIYECKNGFIFAFAELLRWEEGNLKLQDDQTLIGLFFN